MQVSHTCYDWIQVYFQLGFQSVFLAFLGTFSFSFFLFFFLLKNLSFFWSSLSGHPVKVTISEKWFDINTAKNTVISSDFLVLEFCEKAQFPHSFG